MCIPLLIILLGGKPNTPSHPVTAGHVADGQRGSGVGGITCGIGYGYELAIFYWVLGIQDQRMARV